MSVDFWLKLLPPTVQALSVLVTAVFATISLNAWRRQMDGKRKYEVAEEVLVATLQAKAALDWIRNGAVFEGEAIDRPKIEGETESEGRRRDSYYVPLKRIRENSDRFVALSKAYLLCKIHFGSEAAQAIDNILSVQRCVAVDARMLLDSVGDTAVELDKPFSEQLRKSIWGRHHKDEPSTVKLEAAVKTIEDVCSEYLK